MRKILKSIILVMLFYVSACVNPSMQGKLQNSSAILLLLKKNMVPEISYSSKSFVFLKGSAVSAVPTVKGTVKNCTVFPSLPGGLNFDKGTCTVSGTPQSLQSEIQYTVTASEVSGKTFGTQIGISVNPVPIKLNYPDSPYSFFKNSPVTAVSPVLTGTAVSYSISPSLPAGMVFDTQTGQISGTPTVYSPAADYTVTVTGERETQTSVISLTVDFMRPWPVLQPILTVQAGLGVSAAETATTIGTLAGPGTNWYGGVLAPNGIIYGIPRLHTSVLRIDPSSNTVSTFGTFAGGVQKWWGGVLAPNGKIYGIPNSATNILLIDPDTDTAGTFGSVAGGWAGGVLAPNGKIYSIPNNATNVLVIDPKTDTTYTFGSLPGTAAKWVGGVLAPNGKIYGIPHNSTNVLVIDPNADTVSTFGAMPGGGAWRGGVLAPNGKIYGMPSSSTSVLVIDPSNNTTYTFGALGTTSPVNQKWQGGVLAPNGKIYGIACSSPVTLVIDPAADTAAAFGALGGSGGYKWTGGVLAPNGKIYGMSANSGNVLVIDPKSNGVWPADAYLSPYLDKL